MFDNTLYNITKSRGRYGGETIQPLEITQLIYDLYTLPKDAKIFNPFAGLASFGVNLDKNQNYFGQELNRKTWAIGTLRIMAYDRSHSSRYVCTDSVLDWPDASEKFDLIVSNPPYYQTLGNKFREVEPRLIRTAEQLVINKGLSSLNDNGKLIILLSQEFLFQGMYDKRLRQIIIEEDILDTVISLPGGLLSNTGSPFIILVINKKKETPEKVRFIRADKYVEAKAPREKKLNIYALNSLIHGNRKDNDSLRIINNAQIIEWDYNLSVPRYFQNEITLANNEQLVTLKDILHNIGQERGLPKKGKLVRTRDLKDDKIDFHLKISNLEDSELSDLFIKQISENCLLIDTHSRTLKPTYFVYEGIPIYRTGHVLAFKIDESIADYGYLINELHADYVQEQLESYRLGVSKPFIHRDDLMEIAIKLPSLKEQKAKVRGIYESSDIVKKFQEMSNTMWHRFVSERYEDFSTTKHSLGTPLLNIGSSLRNIEKALYTLNPDWEEVKLNERYDLTIKDSFNSVYSNLELIHSILKNNENTLDTSNYDINEVDFLVFIKGYIKKIKSAEKANINLDIHPDIENQFDNKI